MEPVVMSQALWTTIMDLVYGMNEASLLPDGIRRRVAEGLEVRTE